MRAFAERVIEAMSAGLLYCAALFVARSQRADWLQEWRAELWYAQRAYAGEYDRWRAAREVLRFSLGAVEDARALRQRNVARRLEMRQQGSARECVLLLLALLAISLGIGLLLPAVRANLRPAHVRDVQDVMLIEDSGWLGQGVATLPAAQYELWKHERQRIFESFSFYQMEHARAEGDLGRLGPVLRVAHASRDVFSTLNLEPRVTQVGGASEALLSAGLWEQFVASGHAAGDEVLLGATWYRVAGAAPAVASGLPGRPEVWVLSHEEGFAPGQRGYVLGRLNASFRGASWGGQWHMAAPLPDGEKSDFTCVSLAQDLRQPWDLYVFGVLLALLALPATTSLPLGEYRTGIHELRRGAQVRRWSFLGLKMVLALTTVYCVSMVVAFANPHVAKSTSESLQLMSCFGLCLWSMRWVLRDQRQRCPVCLGKLTHPARVGHPSRNFLAWNGTELVCLGGHGLLHVPELPTSWFSTQRWLCLDASWQVLFAERGALPAG